MLIALRLVLFAIFATDLGHSLRQCELPFLEDSAVIQKIDDEYFDCDPSDDYDGSASYCLLQEGNEPVLICAQSGCSIPNVKNAVVTSEQGDISVRVTCKDGFALAGHSMAYCNGTHWDRTLGSCMEKTSVPLSCDFESDMCGWSNGNVHNWMRSSSTSASQLPGPPHDHSTMQTNSGHFMRAEWDGNDMTATLLSPVYPAELSKDGCFHFWYCIFGYSDHFVYVYVQPESKGVSIPAKATLFRIEDDGANEWKMGSFSVPALDENFQIAIMTSDFLRDAGAIFIDDVRLMTGSECSPNTGTDTPVEYVTTDSNWEINFIPARNLISTTPAPLHNG